MTEAPHFEPGLVTLARPARSIASRPVEAGDYEIVGGRTLAGNYKIHKPAGRFIAILTGAEIARTTRTNAHEGEK
jgi:hypothetical protein